MGKIQIRYEEGKTRRELKKEQEEHDSVLRQLELTDYEQIRRRLDACMEWLQEYPGRLQACVEEKTQKQERIRALEEQTVRMEESLGEYQRRAGYLSACFEAELRLEYVALPEKLPETAEKIDHRDAQSSLPGLPQGPRWRKSSSKQP